jgi:hypothetical protein
MTSLNSQKRKLTLTRFFVISIKELIAIEESPCGPLSPRHGASSGCGRRRRPPDVEGSCEYTEQ